MKVLIGCLAALSLAGCSLLKLNVNGKTLSLGGAPSAEATSTSSAAAPGKSGPAPVNEDREVQTVALAPSLTDDPVVVTATGVSVASSFSKTLGVQSPDCGNKTSGKPLAAFELKEAMPKGFVVAVNGGGNDGLAIKGGPKGLIWTSCVHSTGVVPTMGAPTEGWAPGKYEVYAVSRSNPREGLSYQIEFFNPENRAPWSDKIQQLSITKKLDKPLFVDVTLKKGRRSLRKAHAGSGCKLPLPTEPDLAVTLERPIPGLVIRPLFNATPVEVRIHEPDAGSKKGRKYCASYRREVVANNYAPTWESPVEYHFSREAEGTFGLSLGTENADQEMKVTLMIFDASTRFDPTVLVAPAGELPLTERLLSRYYPQLDIRELSFTKPEQLELTSRVFAGAPKELFVYSKLDLDKDIAKVRSGWVDGQPFPKKNEPLLLLSANEKHVRVLTADGVRYELKATHVLPAPEGGVAVTAAPRPIKQDLRFGDVLSMAPRSAKAIIAAYEARMKKYDSCAARVWRPYGKQIDGARWTVRDSSGGSTTIESPKAKRVRAQGNAAVEKSCGSEEKLQSDREATRRKLLGEVEKERTRKLASANARF